MVSVVWDDCGQLLPAVHSTELLVRKLHEKAIQYLSFQFLLGNSIMSLWTEDLFRFLQVLIKILCSELNVFHFIALLLCKT